jgi:flagellar biosynthetic protein FlhB
MTKQEVKDEQKETDGDPLMKRRVRERQREIMQRRMMAHVPKADVIITNPSHFSVALKYEYPSMPAPVLTAKGADLVALQIRRIAAASHVPVVSSPLLARALYYTTELDHEIPVELYRAVAQVLAHVFELRTADMNSDHGPIDMADVEVPAELLARHRLGDGPDTVEP